MSRGRVLSKLGGLTQTIAGISTFVGVSTFASNVRLHGNLTVDGTTTLSTAIANSNLANSTITVSDGSNSTATALGGTVTFSGTNNEVDVAESSGTITIGLPNDVTIGNNLTVTGNLQVDGDTVTVNTSTLTVEDKNIEIAKGAANDTAADGAGITVDSGDGDKTWQWVNATDSWTSSEHIDLASNKNIKINGTNILGATQLGSSVVTSSLTEVGTITTGVWNGTPIANANLANTTVSYGGVTLQLGATDSTPAFDLQDATGYPTSSLVGTITNVQLAGSIANGKLSNSTISFGGVSLALGASDATPAFDLTDATNYPTSSLSGTITNAQLAGSIANSKLSNSTVSYGGVSLALGGTDATPAFNLADATGLPISSGVSGLASNVATFLGTPSSSNFASVLTDETGSGSVVFSASPSFTGDITVTDTAADATAGPEFKFHRNSSSPADADYLGQIQFAGESDTGTERNYAKITGKILDASNGTEDGAIEFSHIKGGSEVITGRFRSDSLQLLNGTGLAVNGAITTDSTVDGRDVASDGTKLDGIESGATADQTAAEIRTLVESASDSNVFTDADHSKLNGIEASATADQTAAEIRTLVDSATDSNVFTDDDHTKLDGIEASATADQTAAEIRTLVDSASDSNVFTDADHSKLDGIESNATADQTDEEIQDIVGAMLTGNTESGITVTYQDADGTIDFTVASQTDENFTTADHSKLDGIEAGATADQTASEILTLIKTVDGAGSGLDADTLDGISSASFLRSDASDTFTGTLTVSGAAAVDNLSLDGNTLTTSSGNLTIDSAGGTTTLADNVAISGNLTVNGTTTTVNATTVNIADKNIQVATGAADDAAADGGGITIDSGDGDKTFQFEATGDNFGSSENMNLADGKVYKIDNTSVLSATTLGSGVTGSSLTSLGTISSGVWQGTAINDTYIGTINNANKVSLSALNIDGGTDIGAALADADLLIVDDGAGGTNRKMAASRLPTYLFGKVSGDIAIASNGTATIQANSVALSTDTTGNYVAAGAVSGNGLSGSAGSEGATFTVTSNATNANTASTIVFRDSSGDFSAGTITASLTGNVTGNTSGSSGSCTGNAATATKLATARTIAGVSFDGSSNISLNNNAITNGAGYITATLTNEQVQDIVGGMVSSNTESGITVTYQDGDGTLDFSVASQTDNNFTNADHSKLDGIESGATADQTASEILTLIKTVDGSGSGLDADTLDGVSSGSFLRSDTADTMTATLTARAITPQADSTYNLGTNSVRWSNVYADNVRTGDLHLSNERRGGNDIDGTWGHYQIQEGEDDLFLFNKRSGKKYRFLLQQV